MEPHVANDSIIGDKEIRKIEGLLNSETEAWINILQIG